VAGFFIIGQEFQLVAPFIRPPAGKGDTSLPYWLASVVGIVILLAVVVCWAVWQIVLPWAGKYRFIPRHSVLSDGTTVVNYTKQKLI
jgi:hypothetical protein